MLAAGDPGERARALDRASEPPLAIAECAAEVAEAAAETAAAGTWAFRADAVVAGELAAAAALGGAELVAANLGGAQGDPRIARARAAAERAARARGSGEPALGLRPNVAAVALGVAAALCWGSPTSSAVSAPGG